VSAANELSKITPIRDTSAQDVVLDSAPRLKRRRKLLIAAGAGALVVLIALYWIVSSWSSTTVVVPRNRIRIATVGIGQFVSDAAAQGVIVAAQRPTLYAPASGTVSFLVRAGDAVKQGQVLATLDALSLKNELQRERATLDGMNLALERQGIEVRRQILKNKESTDTAGVQSHAALRELKRIQSAVEMGVTPARELARATDDFDAAKIKHEHAVENAKLEDESLQFELKSKRLDRDRQRLLVDNLTRRVGELTVRSPVTGIVGSLAINEKSAVGENAALLTVIDLSAFEIEFQIAESYAASIAAGMPAEVAYGGRTYAASVTAISPEVRQNEVTGRVKFTDQVPAGIRQNQRVNVRILMDQRDAVLKVERGAFVDAGNVGYVISGDTATRRPITLGAMSVSEVEVLNGLSAGDSIVISDLTDFKNAPTVRLVN